MRLLLLLIAALVPSCALTWELDQPNSRPKWRPFNPPPRWLTLPLLVGVALVLGACGSTRAPDAIDTAIDRAIAAELLNEITE